MNEAEGRPGSNCPAGRLALLLLLLLTLLGGATPAWAQLQAARWYFGRQAGLDFRQAPPVPRPEGQLNYTRSSSSVADSLGNLLFYTNGDSVWNRQHQLMLNGATLAGSFSSPALFQTISVAQPANSARYYVFTTSSTDFIPTPEQIALRYAVLDLSRQAGLGEVLVKRQILLAASTVRVMVCAHANGRDQWIIAHEMDTDRYLTYLLTASGLQTTPVVSQGGVVHTTFTGGRYGQMKVSPDGRQVATALVGLPTYPSGLVELLDFDPRTGRLSSPQLLVTPNPPPSPDGAMGHSYTYGLEFSPSGQLLYVSDAGNLSQYDLTATNIAASRFLVAGYRTLDDKAALQAGIDGRIYVAQGRSPALGLIAQPDRQGLACDYRPDAVGLGGRQCSYGLPSFAPQDLWNFQVVRDCTDPHALRLAFPAAYAPDSVRWDFGDPAAGAGNGSADRSPRYRPRAPGRYLMSVRLYYGAAFRRLRHYVDTDAALARPPACATAELPPGASPPNVITPNGDGLNDYFLVPPTEDGTPDPTWELYIFNRWGRQVYQAAPYRQDWQAQGLDSGIYHYLLRNAAGGRQRGWVEVIR